ncbi:DUF3237 domain-containing protein [Pseudahrensia aquimaris]|uniref:UPF0311 protein ACFQ14_13075 n=1 Tax=Pseudahrensia aquimaris TaxID=744461 RepID=A0ABW3FJD2_9HYPH
MEIRPLFKFQVSVGEPHVTPDGPYGIRRFIPILGGSFEGERLNGAVLPGGADCQLIRPDGVAELEVRCTFQTDDGVIFLMKGLGMRHGPAEVLERIAKGEPTDPSEYYFRETMIFEAPAGKYEWLNKLQAIGTGERLQSEVKIDCWEIL